MTIARLKNDKDGVPTQNGPLVALLDWLIVVVVVVSAYDDK